MGRSPLCAVLLSIFLLLLLSHSGFGRRVSGKALHIHASHQGRKSREVIELDYEEAGANVNPGSGFIVPSQPPPPPPPPPPGFGH